MVSRDRGLSRVSLPFGRSAGNEAVARDPRRARSFGQIRKDKGKKINHGLVRRIHPLFRSIFTAHFSRIAIQGRSRGTATRTAVFTVIFHHPVRNGNCERVPSCMGDSYSCLCRAHPILHPIPSTQWIAGEPAVIRFTGSCRWSKRSHPLFRRNSSNFSRECTLFLLLLKETTLRTSAFLLPRFLLRSSSSTGRDLCAFRLVDRSLRRKIST